MDTPLKDVRTKADYEEYRRRVTEFFEKEEIENLSGGRVTCERCRTELNRDGDYPTCANAECPAFGEPLIGEPFFSWRACDCCRRPLGGSREDATGYNRKEKRIQEYVICEDCIYFAAYGRLDDMTMLTIEDSKDVE